jgi:hypothetical protein
VLVDDAPGVINLAAVATTSSMFNPKLEIGRLGLDVVALQLAEPQPEEEEAAEAKVARPSV